MAGHFSRGIRVLHRTGWPVFVMMRETKKAAPLSQRARSAIVPAVPEGEKRSVRSAMWNLYQSKRYLQAFLPDDAVTFGLDGKPEAPVTDHERRWALSMLKRRRIEPHIGRP